MYYYLLIYIWCFRASSVADPSDTRKRIEEEARRRRAETARAKKEQTQQQQQQQQHEEKEEKKEKKEKHKEHDLGVILFLLDTAVATTTTRS